MHTLYKQTLYIVYGIERKYGHMVKIALDAMGGDFAPGRQVEGAVAALNEADDIFIYLTGKTDEIKAELAKYKYDESRVEIVDATEVIDPNEPPVKAIRQKKDSSIVKGLYLVKEGKADAFVSSGSSGAVLVGGQLIVGRLKGVERAPFSPFIPNLKGCSLLIDCGANVDARPEHLVSFARMGSEYYKNAIGVEKPRVAIANIGAEEEKGNALVKSTYPLLKECSDINFVGSIEPTGILEGDADVIVCEAFTGNLILKTLESTATMITGQIKKGLMSTFVSKIGAALALPALKKTLKGLSTEDYGGAPMLGLKGLVVKAHGSAKVVEIKNALLQCKTFKEQDINGKIKTALGLED